MVFDTRWPVHPFITEHTRSLTCKFDMRIESKLDLEVNDEEDPGYL